MATPDPIIAAYIKELNTPCVVSYSNVTLHRLNAQHGYDKVSELLRNYFAAERAECTAHQKTN